MTTLNDTITASTGCDTITLSNNGIKYGSAALDTITINSSYDTGLYSGTMLGTSGFSINSGLNTINGISSNNNFYTYNGFSSNWSAAYGKPFEDNFPEWNAFKKLCNNYPGLDKAYENLKTIYTICYEDSILPKDDE